MTTTLENLKGVLCPYDFTPACQASLRESARLAARLGARLHVLHVVITPPIVVLSPNESLAAPPPIDPHNVLEAVQSRRTPEIQAELARAGVGADVTIAFQDGMHADLAILEYAESAGIGLIVMAKHARAPLSRLLIGSTTERVLRHAPCPVLVIPAADPRRPS
jgi:nucleotide-binding universal stress UspA family protein